LPCVLFLMVTESYIATRKNDLEPHCIHDHIKKNLCHELDELRVESPKESTEFP
jgi:hypothetical protein